MILFSPVKKRSIIMVLPSVAWLQNYWICLMFLWLQNLN